MHDILSNPRHGQVVAYYTMALAFSRAHSALGATVLAEYGDHGSQISGCIRDHFPAHIKDTLRHLARNVTEYCELAEKARPARMYATTLSKIARELAKRDGTGFYGPQA